MSVFTYPLFFKLIYRYGNIPATLILGMYLYFAVTGLDQNLLNLIPLAIVLVLVYLLNRHYLLLYKIVPYKIEADKEKLTGSEFFFSGKKITIYYNDISELKGGVFDGKFGGVMKIFDTKRNAPIGFFPRIRNADKLETILLSNVKRNIYDSVVERLRLKDKSLRNK